MTTVPILNSTNQPSAQLVGGQYNATPPAPINGQTLPLQQDDQGNLYVNIAEGGGGSASSTTASVPAQTAVGSIATVILPANSARLEATIVNTGITVVYLALNGQTPTTTAYHIALPACGTANDGTGGTYTTDLVKGAIKAICSSSGTVVVTELTP